MADILDAGSIKHLNRLFLFIPLFTGVRIYEIYSSLYIKYSKPKHQTAALLQRFGVFISVKEEKGGFGFSITLQIRIRCRLKTFQHVQEAA